MGDWRYHLTGLSSQDRSKAVRAYERAAEHVSGQGIEATAAALRKAAAAEGLCTADLWIDPAAVELSRNRQGSRTPDRSEPAIIRPAPPGTESSSDKARDTRLRNLLEHGGPSIVLQPIVELATGRCAGAEALARFPGQPGQAPDAWFADATAAGLGVELELSAIRAALALLDRFPCSTYLSINASPATVTSDTLLELLATAPADRLVLELTEHIQISDYDTLAGPLNRLRWRGVRLAVDDAGSGYSSLQHILNIAPDIIKLDAALIRDIDTDPARLSLAASLRIFADQTGAAVVAEGVETEGEHAALLGVDIRYGQGYYYGRPAPRLPDHLGGLVPRHHPT